MLSSGSTLTRLPRYCFLLVIVLSLSACGFQLRGALEITDEMSPLYLQQNNAFELGRELKQLLLSNNIEVTDSSGKANSQLIILNEMNERRVLSVDTDGRVREYLLIYTVNFSIQFTDDEAKMGERLDRISVRRSLLFDQDAVLAVANESEILYKEMRRDVARLILLKVQAHSTDVKSDSVVEPDNNSTDIEPVR